LPISSGFTTQRPWPDFPSHLYREAWVRTEPDNAAALAFYSKLGGVRSRTYVFMFTFPLTGDG
jgi:hypothetical protein